MRPTPLAGSGQALVWKMFPAGSGDVFRSHAMTQRLRMIVKPNKPDPSTGSAFCLEVGGWDAGQACIRRRGWAGRHPAWIHSLFRIGISTGTVMPSCIATGI